MPHSEGAVRYFGTDGIRGVFGSELTEELAQRVGAALGRFFGGSCILGRDTRLSGSAIEQAVAKGIIGAGCNVCFAGVLPTPAVAYLASAAPFNFGVMITASHNPPDYNGIKIFDGNGCKLESWQEEAVEHLIHSGQQHDCLSSFGGFVHGKTEHFLGARDRYIDFIVAQSKGFCASMSHNSCGKYAADKFLASMKNDKTDKARVAEMRWADRVPVWLDCGHGAASGIASEVFERLGARVRVINDAADGSRINIGCGALFVDRMRDMMIFGGSDLGSELTESSNNLGGESLNNSDCKPTKNFGDESITNSCCEPSKNLDDESPRNFCDKSLAKLNCEFDANCKQIESTTCDLAGDGRAPLGFAFDGDADRMAMVWNGEVIDGDSVLYSLSRVHCPSCKTVVGTVMSNLALERRLFADGKRLIRADVGDKNILLTMRQGGYFLGGEQSGHYIFRPHHTTGDGILAAVKMTFASLLGGIERLDLVPQKTISLTCDRSVLQDERLIALVDECKRLPVRVLVRPSGTEPKVRIMAEGDSAEIDGVLDKFVRVISDIG